MTESQFAALAVLIRAEARLAALRSDDPRQKNRRLDVRIAMASARAALVTK